MKVNQIQVYTFLCGISVSILALTVMYGWFIDDRSLIQVHPNFAPMQFNTALGLLICSFGAICISWEDCFLSKIFGLLSLLLGALTLYEYVFDTGLGIDQLFFETDIITKTSHLGRPSPMTAFCFSTLGLAFLSDGKSYASMMGMALTVFVLSSLALLSYLLPQDSIYGWGALSRMAIHTASGFFVLSISLLMFILWNWEKIHFDIWRVLPFSTTIVVIFVTFFAWYTHEESVKKSDHTYVLELIADTQEVLLERYDLYEKALQGGLGLFYASDTVEREEWKKYVRALEVDQSLPGINGIGYIDYVLEENLDHYLLVSRADGAPDFDNHPKTKFKDKFIIKYIEPVYRNKEAVGLDIGFELNRRETAERARDLGVPALTKKILLVQDHQKHAGFLLLIPFYRGGEIPQSVIERRKKIVGWVYAPFIAPNFLSGVGDINKNQLDLEVYDGEQTEAESLIYASSKNGIHPKEFTKGLAKKTQITIAGKVWTILWYTNDNFKSVSNQLMGYIILGFGFTFAVFLYISLNLLIRSKNIIQERVNERTRELKESETRHSAILNNAIDAILTINETGLILSFNPAAEKMFGYKAEEIIGTSVIGLISLKGRSPDVKQIERFIKMNEDKFIGVTRTLEGKTKNDMVFPVEVSVSCVDLEKGKIFSVIIRDVTEARNARMEILKTNQELERSNHELERFAYIVSHDLQEPLRKISGFTDRLARNMEGQLDEKTLTYMKFITGGVERMRELIMGLLAYSRVTTTEIAVEELDANVIVASALDILSQVIEENNAKIVLDPLPTVFFDKVMLTQVFQNLIGNALKYRSEKVPCVEISARKDNNFWVFLIKDNGIGIEEKYSKRIFEMFQRLHRQEDIKGTGIGLSPMIDCKIEF